MAEPIDRAELRWLAEEALKPLGPQSKDPDILPDGYWVRASALHGLGKNAAKILALLDALEKAEARLQHNRCNSGHETLPLILWDCPACVDIIRARAEQAEARLSAIDALGELKEKLRHE